MGWDSITDCPRRVWLVQVKIGDFGFMQRLKHSNEAIQVDRVTHPRWMAPEVRPALCRRTPPLPLTHTYLSTWLC